MQVIEWLLKSDPWTEYGTRIALLGQSYDDESVVKARMQMLNSDKVQKLLDELLNWDKQEMSNHRNANLLIGKLAFIADIGLSINDPKIGQIVDAILKNKGEDGLLSIQIKIPEYFGGPKEAVLSWMACDVPLIISTLIKLGVEEKVFEKEIKTFINLKRENGYPCAVGKSLGKFHGPGKKSDPCPYATLLILKLLAVLKQNFTEEKNTAAECLLNLWDKSLEIHPYMFYMGTDFRKLKAPLFWYSILNVADALSVTDFAKSDSRYLDMLNVIKSKSDGNYFFIPESVWKTWAGWDFGQKKSPSAWITFLVLRILKRSGDKELIDMLKKFISIH